MKKSTGNPQIVATNGEYNIIKRGTKVVRYAKLQAGKPLNEVTKWYSKGILLSALMKGNYQVVDPPKDYIE